MSTNSKNKSTEALIKGLRNIDDEFDLDFETRMINYRFLSIVDEKMEELDLSKKDLAEAIGTSASYITQLFNGSKILNLNTLAKLQNALDIKFKVSDQNKKIHISKEEIDNYIKGNLGREFFVVYTSPKKDSYNWNPPSDLLTDPKNKKYAS